MNGDRGDIVLGWLTKVVVVLAIIGLFAFEVISIAVARVRAADTAENAAYEASEEFIRTKNAQQAYETAYYYVRQHDGELRPEEFAIAPDGRVTLTVHRTASTLFVHKIDAFKDVVETSAEASVRSAS